MATPQAADERRVRVKIVETNVVNNYKVVQKAPRDERKYEKAYVRRMAKEFGWTIQAGAKRKKTNAT